MGNMHKKLGEDRTCISGDMVADKRTHRQTHTDTLITILRSPIGDGGVTTAGMLPLPGVTVIAYGMRVTEAARGWSGRCKLSYLVTLLYFSNNAVLVTY